MDPGVLLRPDNMPPTNQGVSKTFDPGFDKLQRCFVPSNLVRLTQILTLNFYFKLLNASKKKFFEILIPAASSAALQDFTLRFRFWWTIMQQAAGKCPL